MKRERNKCNTMTYPIFNHVRCVLRSVLSQLHRVRAPEARPSECTFSLFRRTSPIWGFVASVWKTRRERERESGRLANQNVFQPAAANLFPDQKHILSFHPLHVPLPVVAYFGLDSPLFLTIAVQCSTWLIFDYTRGTAWVCGWALEVLFLIMIHRFQ